MLKRNMLSDMVGSHIRGMFLSVVVGMGLTQASLLLGQAPPNDLFTNRVPLSGFAWTISGNNTSAVEGRETGEPNGYAGTIIRTMWYEWTAPTNGLFRMDTFGSSFNTILGVFTNATWSSGIVEEILIGGNNDASGTLQSRVTFNAVSGAVYQIQLGSHRYTLGSQRATNFGPFLLNGNFLPISWLTAPGEGTKLTAPATLTMTAQVRWYTGSVSRVEFYLATDTATNLAGTITAPPYQLTVSNVTAGRYRLYTRVEDNRGDATFSPVVNIEVVEPGAVITSPAMGTFFGITSNIVISADAFSMNSITSMQFFSGTNLIGQAATAPASIHWTTFTPGGHDLRVVARDSQGNAYTSAVVTVYIKAFAYLLRAGTVWKYHNLGQDLGMEWKEPAYNDAAWAAGPAELGFGDGDEVTVIDGGPSSARYSTIYFRQSFVATNVAMITNLICYLKRDDGAVVWLNGQRLYLDNMEGNPVLYSTLALVAAPDDGANWNVTNLPPTALVEGTNVLAVEMHQSSLTSSDLSFNFEMVAEYNAGITTVALTSPLTNSYYLTPAIIPLRAVASHSLGSPLTVSFFQNGIRVGEGVAEGNEWGLTLTNVALGTHSFFAVARDAMGYTATSMVAQVSVYNAWPHWTAYNDHAAGAGTGPNVSTYNVFGANAGPLTNVFTGERLAATMTATANAGVEPAGTMGVPLPETPAYNLFNGYVDFQGEPYAAILLRGSVGGQVVNTFAGLSPAALYSFRSTSVRGNAAYTNRWTLVRLTGARAFRSAHTAGVLTRAQLPNLAANEAVYNSGFNTAGEVVGWDDIVPGTNGSFAVVCEQYTGTLPGGTPTDGPYGYSINAFRLEEAGPPLSVTMTAPANNSVYQGPTNLTLSATATGTLALARVAFFADGALVGEDATSPYSIVWTNATWATNRLTAVAYDVSGGRATSAVVTVTVNPPPVNTDDPVVLLGLVSPAPGSRVTNLTSINVRFSEPVTGVNASDLLVNGVPATAVSGSGSNYTFTMAQPAIGTAQISWAVNHGIQDLGFPPRAFDATAPGATWTYEVVDGVPPGVVGQAPAANSTVTNLTSVTVTFSEPVVGVDASDFLVNGVPAYGLSGSGNQYTFTFGQPWYGTVNITWATNHGITDVGGNPMNAAAATNRWNYTMRGQPVILVASNAVYRWLRGTNEASLPTNAWREIAFNDTAWEVAPAPFFYDTQAPLYTGNTALTDMQSNYATIYLRHPFVITTPLAVTNLVLYHKVDDGFVAWLNGVEVARYNVSTGELAYSALASSGVGTVTEYTAINITNWSALVAGTNVLAIHALNSALATSSDFLLDVYLGAEALDPGLLAPRVVQVTPPPGRVYALTNIIVTFSRAVTGVNAADLLVNGSPAVSVSGSGDTYHFQVAQPAYGAVNITWAVNHGIMDLNNAPFDATAPGAVWSYRLMNPNAPVITQRSPAPESLVVSLTNASVTFSRSVTGVDAADFLINGTPATAASGSESNYVFTFARPAYGQVQFSWAANANIMAAGSPQDVFDSTDPLANWAVTFVFQEPPVVARVTPTPTALTNLTEVVVEFSEEVVGVDASDLLLNGEPVSAVEGSGTTYRFTFAQPPVGTAQFTWASGHGIRDLGVPSLGLDGTAPGNTWSYTILDGVPPVLISRSPAPGQETPVASTITVQFSEPVVGVDAADVLVDLRPAVGLTALASNIYVFNLPALSYGYHTVIWSVTNGITDIKGNPFNRAAHAWSFIYYNSNAPAIAERIPAPNSTTNELTNIWVRFDRPVTGVDAEDLLVNYEPALTVTATNGGYLFTFPQPPYGAVPVTWDLNANIADASQPANVFETFRPSANWQINLEYQAPPEIAEVVPARGSSVGVLSQITVVFSEAVVNVDAGDLLLNGVPATNVVGSGSNYVFRFPQVNLGTVNVTWAANHGIRDVGIPPMPFDHTAPGASWSYTVVETTPPVVTSQTPPADAVVSNLFFVQVTFSEPVLNVDAADLLVNNVPAFSLSGSNNTYIFYISSPAYGTVNVRWAANHGITDLVGNPFDANGAGATWNYTLQPPRVILIASNSVWSYRLGTNEVSNPIEAWRLPTYNAAAWPTGITYFYYGDPLSGTLIPAMNNNAYSSLYLRKTFVIEEPAFVTNLLLRVAVDDGYVAWINGVEVARFNMGSAGNPVFYNSFATANATELPGGGPDYYSYPLSNPAPSTYLVRGTNVLAIHGFNVNATSSDFALNAELSAEISGSPANLPPVIIGAVPASGDVFALSNLVITFSKPVTGVDAADLLVNGQPATGLSGSNNIYTFTFPQPPYGSVLVNWAAGNGIRDLSVPPLFFDGSASSARFIYNLLNPNAPVVVNKTPDGSQTVTQLTSVTVKFSKAVTGVDAADFLVNGNSATGVSGGGSVYTFTFPQPAYGTVQFGWAQNHGITDLDNPPNAFDQRRPGASWQVQLIDRTAPFVAQVQPALGSTVSNLNQVTVTFSENVTGVDARDLLINGTPALSVSGGGSNYVFTFAPVNASIIRFSWVASHGIADTASSPNLFDGTAPSARWQYYTVDTTPPVITSVSPIPGAVVVSLREISVTFSEPVQGVEASALLVNGLPANSVNGAGAGPYMFNVPSPLTGLVQVTWAPGHVIRDLASPPNRFTGGGWTYTYEPEANYAGKVVISEIMYNTPSFRTDEEWLEIRNLTPAPINITGWRFNRGVDFTFPPMTLPAYGYWVVASDTNRFRQLYPNVTNVIGNWQGQLSNNGEDVELETAWGARVDLVPYASEGDWAIRRRGSVTYQNGHRGWEWYTTADGWGSSLELINTNLPSQYGQNWQASTVTGGTPGAANSVAVQNSAPLIIGVEHSPAMPTATNTVRISALILDEQTSGLTVTLYWRNASSTTPGNFTTVPMRDDGQGGDWVAGDRVYSGQVPPQTNLTIVEFYVEARDAANNTRTWPGPAYELDGSSMGQVANALYQVDNDSAVYPQPQYRLIMTGAERQEIQNIWQVDNATYRINAEMNTTFIASDSSGTAVRYLCGVRNRGNSSRCSTCNPGGMQNYRINIPTDNLWRNQRAFNLNCKYVHSQYMGSIMFRKAGLPCEEGNLVRLKLNGVELVNMIGSAIGGPGNNQPFPYYLHLEELNSDWAENHYPDNADGNMYRLMRVADLLYRGTNYTSYTTGGYNYSKASNQRVNDWSDLYNMLWAINNTPDAQWAAAVREVIHVDEWVRHFAVMSLIGFGETSIGSDGAPDDATIYLGTKDRRAVIMPHDGDTNFGEGDGSRQQPTISIWRAVETSGAIAFNNRFLRHQEFAPLYFGALYEYATTIFATNEIFATYDQVLGPLNIGTTVARMKNWSAQRVASVLSQINLNLVVTNLSSFAFNNGVYVATTPNINLRGVGNMIHTRQVRVQGIPVSWTAWTGQWNANLTLNPGYNLVRIETVNSNNVVFASTNLVFFYDRGDTVPVSGTISTDTTWLAANGPYNVTGTLTVGSGATLTIQAGTTVYLGSGVNLVVANGGRLLAEGTAAAPIRFTRAPGASTTWGGITVNGSANSPESRLVHVMIEHNNSTAITVTDGTVWLDNVRFGNTARQYLELTRASFVVQNCEFPAPTGAVEPTHGTGGIKAGGRGIFRRNFWGKVSGYNDALDFTGGQRPGPVLVLLNNVFLGSDDDLLDLDGTDAWVEGNVFVRARRAGSTPDSGSAISGGQNGGQRSRITAVNNLFYDLDHVANAKEGNFYVLRGNTVVWQNGVGSVDGVTAVAILADEGTAEGRGCIGRTTWCTRRSGWCGG
ncbi:Ig-like domain-containing protein [Fontisphaera persica]|uniref:Ig-like domain-containing protein n=1 Tax=Fontisphaera persica TaxID=2974023 RepID=UPI0024BF4242|nr:Ig-like domain-containing protein [Fontisphaera persica]WCJ60043.1 Ig-like domain-containing protein [Fontisphaera persica]